MFSWGWRLKAEDGLTKQRSRERRFKTERPSFATVPCGRRKPGPLENLQNVVIESGALTAMGMFADRVSSYKTR